MKKDTADIPPPAIPGISAGKGAAGGRLRLIPPAGVPGELLRLPGLQKRPPAIPAAGDPRGGLLRRLAVCLQPGRQEHSSRRKR